MRNSTIRREDRELELFIWTIEKHKIEGECYFNSCLVYNPWPGVGIKKLHFSQKNFLKVQSLPSLIGSHKKVGFEVVNYEF